MSDRTHELLGDHVIISGYGELTMAVLEEVDHTEDAIVITDDQDRAATLVARNGDLFVGSPTEEGISQRERIL